MFYLISANVATNVNQGINSEKVKVAYFAADVGPIAQQFERFLQKKEILTAFDIQKVDTLNDGNQMVKRWKNRSLNLS